MDRRRPLTALLPALLLLTAACGQARETASTVRDCAGLASDVARAGLSGVPTRAELDETVQRLDDRVADLESAPVREAATTLRDRLREVQEAVTSADPAAVRTTSAAARDAAAEAARACGLPADQFVGG